MLERIRYRIMSFYYQVRATKWLMYFRVNGPREWKRVWFDGFRESPIAINELNGIWAGTTTTEEHYFCNVSINSFDMLISRRHPEEAKHNIMDHEKMRGKDMIDSFLLPECRCRLGFHWKCKIHDHWSN